MSAASASVAGSARSTGKCLLLAGARADRYLQAEVGVTLCGQAAAHLWNAFVPAVPYNSTPKLSNLCSSSAAA